MPMRTNYLAVLVQDEVTAGVDPGGWDPAVHGVSVEDALFRPQPRITESREKRGTLDAGDRVIGAIPWQTTFAVPLKGSGTPETPAQWMKLFRYCSWEQSIHSTVIPTAGVGDCTGGTANTVTIDTATETDFPTTTAAAQALVGRPARLTGNPATAWTTHVRAASVAGGILTLTFTEVFSPVLSSATKVEILKDVLLKPTSVTPPTGAARRYLDGKMKVALGMAGDVGITFPSGDRWLANFTMSASLVTEEDEAMVAPMYDATTVRAWKDSRAILDTRQLPLQQATLATNVRIVYPDNPNKPQAIDPVFIPGRDLQMTMNPLDYVDAGDEVTKFAAGTRRSIYLRNGAGLDAGTPAGQRLALVVPVAMALDLSEADREGMAALDQSFQLQGKDNVCMLVQY